MAIILAIAIPMKDSGQCSYQSFDTIAKITGLSKTIMIRVVRMLEMKGLVSTHGGRAGSGHATHYCFNAAGAIGTLTNLNSKSPRIYPRVKSLLARAWLDRALSRIDLPSLCRM